MPDTRLLLLRHGQTDWSRLGRHTGRSDIALTPAGEEQARALAVPLRAYPIVRTFASPLRRARHTAELAGLPNIETEPGLLERDYGGYEGLTYDQIRQREPGWDAWSHDVPPGGPGMPGESVADLGARVDQLLARLRPALAQAERDAGADGAVIALVGHGHTLRVVAARWAGLDPFAGAVLQLDTGALGLLGHVHARRGILAWNFSATH